jgi:hypothetical protein
MSTLKIPAATVKKIDTFRRHCLWRGNDVNSNRLALAAWSMITQPKSNGGLGVVRLETHNKALLLKFVHKFFNNHDLPWVNLVWNNYYRFDSLPSGPNIGSFWWKSLLSLVQDFKGLAAPTVGNGQCENYSFLGRSVEQGHPGSAVPRIIFICLQQQTHYQRS